MRIDYLASHEMHLAVVADWQHSEFGYLNPSVTVEQRKARLSESLQSEKLPITLIAFSDEGSSIGSASILPKTITHTHLTPWLSSVVVPPENRGNGIASALSLRAVTEAARLGFETLYLFTPRNESLYQRLGWKAFERSIYNGLPITLMSRTTDLTSRCSGASSAELQR